MKQLAKELPDSRFCSWDTIPPVETISTWSIIMDSAIWWYVKGWFIEVFWKNSVWKTLCCLLAIKAQQKEWKMCAFLDCEQTFNPEQAKWLWVDLDKLLVMKCASGEDVGNALYMLAKEWVWLVVVDSVAAATPKKELETDIAQWTMWVHARLWNRILRVVVWKASDNWTTVLLINQERDTMEMYAPITTTGGRWIDYATSQRIQILKPEKKDDGMVIRFKAYKNKLWKMWEWGIPVKWIWWVDPKVETIETALSLDIITRAGAYYSFWDTRVQGKDALFDLDDVIINSIEKEVKKKI